MGQQRHHARRLATAQPTPENLRQHADHLGTPRVVTRSVAVAGATTGPKAINKQVWSANTDPFGTSLGNSAPNENPQLVTGTPTQIQAGTFRQNHRFPGQVFDAESGKHQNGYRDYDPIGRYTTSDPIGLAGDLNTYVLWKMTAFACVLVVVLAIAFPGISLPILGVALLATPMIVLAAVCYACCEKRSSRRRFLMSVFGYYAVMSAYLILSTPSIASLDPGYIGSRVSVVGVLLGLPALPASLLADGMRLWLASESRGYLVALPPNMRILIECVMYTVIALIQWTLCAELMSRWRNSKRVHVTQTL